MDSATAKNIRARMSAALNRRRRVDDTASDSSTEDSSKTGAVTPQTGPSGAAPRVAPFLASDSAHHLIHHDQPKKRSRGRPRNSDSFDIDVSTIPVYTPQQRMAKIRRYLEKRQRRGSTSVSLKRIAAMEHFAAPGPTAEACLGHG